MCALRLGYEYFIRSELRIREPHGISWTPAAREAFDMALNIYIHAGFAEFADPIEGVKSDLNQRRGGGLFRPHRFDAQLQGILMRAAMIRAIDEVLEKHSSPAGLVRNLERLMPPSIAAVLLPSQVQQ